MRIKNGFSAWGYGVAAMMLLLAILATGAEASAESVDLSLKTAMGMAIHNNLDLRIDALDSATAKANVDRNRAIYDPFLSMSANKGQTFIVGETYGTEDVSASLSLSRLLPTGASVTASTYTSKTRPVSDFPEDNWTDWYSSAGISIQQPLLKNFGKEATELNIRLSQNSHEVSLEQFRLSVSETIFSVIKTYNRLYTLRQVLAARQKALADARTTRDQIRRRLTSPSGSNMDLANTEYAISQRLKDLVDTERQISDQEAKLLYLIGVRSAATIVPTDPPSSTEPTETTEQAIELALENRADLKQLRLDLDASRMEERVSKRNLLPNLSLNAGLGTRGIDDHFNDSFDQVRTGKGRWWSVGLQLSLPLGNNAAKSDYRRNELRTSQLKKRLTAFEWKLRDYVESDMRALISARIQKQMADKAVKIAEQRVETYRKSVARNTSKVQDLINAENDWISARDSQTTALENFANAVALLWKDTGVLLDRMHISVDIRQPEKLTANKQPLPSASTRGPSVPTVSATVGGVRRAGTPAAAPKASAPSMPRAKVPVAASTAPARPGHKSSPATQAGYTLSIGEFASSELSRVKKQLVAAGVEPQVTNGDKQARWVIRLMVNDYPNLAATKADMRKLARLKAEGFVVRQENGVYRLYGGSYFSRESALRERDRLAAHGLSITLERVSVLLPTVHLDAGRFSSREAALAGAQRLKKLGIAAVVQKEG